jgi:hypothetical protein
MAADASRLYTILLNTGLQTKDNPLHQLLHDLIGHVISTNKQVSTIISGGGAGGGLQGIQGIQGPQGLPGIDGENSASSSDDFVSPIISVQNLNTLFTAGSVIFSGPSGSLAQDPAKLVWDDVNFFLRLYRTFTDSSNYERLSIGASGTTLAILSEALGTGIVRRIRIGNALGGGYWDIMGTDGAGNAGDLRPSTDNSQNIGQSGSAIHSLWIGSTISFTAGASTFGRLYSTVDATLVLNNSLLTIGVGLDFSTDQLLKIRKSDFSGNAALSIGLDAIGSTSTDGLTISNDTISTSIVPVQTAPRIHFKGHVWNTTAVAADNLDEWFADVVLGSGLAPTSVIRLIHRITPGGTVVPYTFNSNGTLTIVGTSSSSLLLSTGAQRIYLGSGFFGMPAASQWNFLDSTATVGFGLDGATDGILKIRNRAQNADAAITYSSYTHSGAEIDKTYQIYAPVTGGTVTMSANQSRAIINPLAGLALLTVTLPPSPVDGQVTGFSFTQIITGLTVNAPSGATVVAPPTTAAVDSTFRFIYQTSSTSWFPCS